MKSTILHLLACLPFLGIIGSCSESNSGMSEPPKITVRTNTVELEPGETGNISFTLSPWNASWSVSGAELKRLSEEGQPEELYTVSGYGSYQNGKYNLYVTDENAGENYNHSVRLSVTVEGVSVESEPFSIRSAGTGRSELPVIRVTASAPVTDTETWVDGTIEIDGNGEFEDLPLENLKIKGRGNSTWAWEKKPYALKFSEKREMLGMPKHKRWCLIANYMDKTLLRNRIAHYIGAHTELGWTPRTRFAELYFNGEYAGNYLVVEQIKIDKNRLNIDEMEPQDVSGDALTGGYLLEMDSYFDEVNKFRSTYSEMPVNIKSPEEEIAPEQFAYIQNYFNLADKRLFSRDFHDSEKGYPAVLDVNSFVDFWIVNELMGNQEIKHPKSFYIHKPRKGKLTAGPIWDFDYGTLTNADAEKWLVKTTNLWMERLTYDPTFRKQAKKRWNALYPFLQTVPTYIEAQRAYIGASAERNFERWPEIKTEQPNGDETLSFDAAVNRLKASYATRLQWLNNQIKAW